MSILSPCSLFPVLAVVWLFTLSGLGHAAGDGVVISEFLAENRNGLRDEDGAAPDWLELHNPTSVPVSLAGMALTDSAADLSKWPLPALFLPPRGYLVVFASGKDRRDPSGTLHTNFALARAGEFLALTSGGNVLAGFAPSFPPQAADVSYGFRNTAGGELVFMRTPTPGQANNPDSAVPGAVGIAQSGGLFSEPFMVTLTTQTPGAAIHFTLDGSVPTADSPRYAVPFTVSATARLRVVAVADGAAGAVGGAAWVQLAPDLVRYTSPLPVMVIENFGGGPVPAKGLSTQQVPAQAAEWLLMERNGASADLSGPPQLSGGIGIRGRGYLSSTWLKKAYAVESRGADGGAAGSAPLGLPSNDDWVLYYPDPGALRDPTLLANTFIYELSRRLGRYAPRFRFVELFLNQDGGALTMADRQGVYVLMEKISRGASRLDFSTLSADGTRGGALLGIDRPDALPEGGFPAENGTTAPSFFRTAGPDRIPQTRPNVLTPAGDDLPGNSSAVLNFGQPGGYRITSPQRVMLETWFRDFGDAIYHPITWRDPVVGWRKWLVEEDWAEGYLLNNFVRHTDALLLSVYPWLGDDRKLRFGPIWDVTPGSYTDQGPPDSALYYRAGQLWFPRLFEDPDFKQTYLDRWTGWRRTGFSDSAMEGIIDRQAAEITAAKAVAQGLPGAEEWQARLTALKTWVKGRAAFFDRSFVPLPVLSPPGGIVERGSVVSIRSGAAGFWLTMDGTDPRLPGGAVSPAAVEASTVVISGDVRITARGRNGPDWSGPVTGVFSVDAVPASAGNPVISEIHYHPAAELAPTGTAGRTEPEDYGFIELHNRAASKVSLHDVRLVLDRDLYEPAWSGQQADQWTIPAGGRLVLVRNRSAFAARYPARVPMGGGFSGSLSRAGQRVALEKADGTPVVEVVYSISDPWPAAAAGDGYSLTLREGGAMAVVADWRTSLSRHGSPGGSDAVAFTGRGDDDWRAYSFGAEPVLTWDSGERLAVRIHPAADEARYLVEESSRLGAWQPTKAGNPVESRLSTGETYLVWRFRNVPAAPFLRVRAVRSP